MSEWTQQPVDEMPNPLEVQPDLGDALTKSIESLFPRNMNRRIVLEALALVATSLLVEDRHIMNKHWGDAATTIVQPGANERTISFYSDALLAAPGYGGTHGDRIIDDYRSARIFSSDYPLAYYRYSPLGITSEIIGQQTTQFADRRRLKSLTMHCDSEGGLIGLTGALAAGRPLRALVLDCCPFDVDDAYQGNGARLIAALNKLGHYKGGLVGKYIVCFLDELHDHGWKQIANEIIDARADTMHGADPRLLVSQAIFLKDADLHARTEQYRARQIFSPDTTVVLCRPRIANSDPTVRNVQAYDKFIPWFGNFGILPIMAYSDAPGHANTQSSIQAAAPHLQNLRMPAQVKYV